MIGAIGRWIKIHVRYYRIM